MWRIYIIGAKKLDIKFSAEDVAFRSEVREFFAAEYDGSASTRLGADPTADYKAYYCRLAKKVTC